MPCASTSLTLESYDEYDADAISTKASGTDHDQAKPLTSRRRHSSFHPRRKSSDHGSMDAEETVLLKVDLFLTELERRLDFLETYSSLNIDASLARAYSTLQAVRARCSQVSGEVLGAGRRRAKVMLEIMEQRYQDTLLAKETLAEKVQTGISILDSTLAEVEGRAYKMRDQGFAGAAGHLMDEGREVVDRGLKQAREVVDEGIERAKREVELIKEQWHKAIHLARENRLISYEDLPIPWRVNPHIVKGYRFTESKVDCIKSMFSISNETVNIWSHAIGCLILLAIAFYFYPTSTNFTLSNKTDIFIAAVFFIAAVKCLVCSTMWHTMNGIAEQTLLERFACVDYTGISLLIAASIMTTEYTAFYCEPLAQRFWLGTTALLGVGGVFLTWHPFFNRSDMSWVRVAFYCSLAATGFVPFVYLSWLRGTEWALDFYAPITKSILVYFTGAVVYGARIPERWHPGAFDYVGGSHNLWHFAVLGGILFHYNAMMQFYNKAFERAGSPECAAIF